MYESKQNKTSIFLGQIAEWNEKYNNYPEAEKALTLQKETEVFRIRVPLIGKFSSGKSTLLNTLMDIGDVLETDIDPETAIPTEIGYSEDDHVYLYSLEDDSLYEISAEQYLDRQYDTTKLKKIRLAVDAESLRDFPDIDLVDMPGFDSGVADHNRILDSDAVKGTAYLLIFSSEDPVVKENMLTILKELLLCEAPIRFAVIVTRAARMTDAKREEIRQYIHKTLSQYINPDFPIFFTDSEQPDSVRDVCDKFLRELQEERTELLECYYHGKAAAMADDLRLYLRKLLRDLELSTSEFEGQTETLERELEKLKKAIQKQQLAFQNTIPSCRDQILADVSNTLYGRESSYVQTMMKGRSPEDEINADIREAVIRGVKTHFEPEVQRYFDQIQASIRSVSVTLMGAQKVNPVGAAAGVGIGAGLTASGVAALTGGSSAVAAVLGSSALGTSLAAGALGSSVVALSVPVIGIALGGLAAVLTFLMSSARKKEKRQECVQKLRAEVFTHILNELGRKLTDELKRAAQVASEAAATEANQKMLQLEKGLKDAHDKRDQNEAQLKAEREVVEKDLANWEEICHEYGC